MWRVFPRPGNTEINTVIVVRISLIDAELPDFLSSKPNLQKQLTLLSTPINNDKILKAIFHHKRQSGNNAHNSLQIEIGLRL